MVTRSKSGVHVNNSNSDNPNKSNGLLTLLYAALECRNVAMDESYTMDLYAEKMRRDISQSIHVLNCAISYRDIDQTVD